MLPATINRNLPLRHLPRESENTLSFLTWGADKRLILPSSGSSRVGRDLTNECVIPDDKAVSKWHAEILFLNGFFHIHDLQSHNGTHVNGRKVDEAVLGDGSVLTIGSTELVLHQVPLVPKRVVAAQLLNSISSLDSPVIVLGDMLSELRGLDERKRKLVSNLLTAVALSKGLADDKDILLVYGAAVLCRSAQPERLEALRNLLIPSRRPQSYEGPLPSFSAPSTRYWLLGLLFELSADTNSSPRALELLNLYATSIGLEATSWQKLRSMGRDLAREHVWDAVIGLALGGLAVKSTAGGKAKKSKAFLEASLRNHPGIGSAVLSLRSPGDAIRSQQEILKQALESLGNIPFAANDDLTETGVLGLRWMFERALRSDLEILRRIRWFEMRGAVKFRRRAVAALEDLRV